MGNAQKNLILRSPSFQYRTWASFSTQVVTEGAIYRPLPNSTEVTIVGAPETRTAIPIYVIVIISVLLLITIVARIATNLTIEKDERPRLNTINGLSSIAREESELIGASLVQGRTMSVGIMKLEGSEGHFGPVQANSLVVSREEVKHIV